jgi:hypothetical protein
MFYRTRRVITMFTIALHLSVSWARPVQSIPLHPVSLKIYFNIIRSPMSRSSYWPPPAFPTKILYAFLFSHKRSTCPAHLILLDLIVFILGKDYKLWCSSLCSFLKPSITSPLLDPNILHSTLFLNTLLSLCSSLNVGDQVSHPYKITGKIIVLCIQIFCF